MSDSVPKLLGFSCAYTPLPLVHAAGLTPYRILPRSDVADQAGSVLHDNICPHVKKILDRALAGELPPLEALIFMDSCDAMRRLCDAWRASRPDDPVVLVDLPVDTSGPSVAFFAQQLGELADKLGRWSGQPVTPERLRASLDGYDALAGCLDELGRHAGQGSLPGGRAALQRILERSVTEPVDDVLGTIEPMLAELGKPPDRYTPTKETAAGVPVFLFGNVLPDPAAFELFEQSGARVVGDDVCTGSRQLARLEVPDSDELEPMIVALARAVLERPSCPRTMGRSRGRELGRRIAGDAKRCGARGVIAHVMKFCDPYLARLPLIQSVLREESLPLLILEGDCTLRSLGQHQTRIEAFVEMLEDVGP